jgi:hypothetical protein
LTPPIVDQTLAEVDLQLAARRRLEANAGAPLGLELSPPRRDRPPDRAQVDHRKTGSVFRVARAV